MQRTAALIAWNGIDVALERGVIDAGEWVGPYDVTKRDLHRPLPMSGARQAWPLDHLVSPLDSSSRPARCWRELLPPSTPRTSSPSRTSSGGCPRPGPPPSTPSRESPSGWPLGVDRVLRRHKKLAAEVVREESEKTPMGRKMHASFTKFQALVGPRDHVAEGVYHQFVTGEEVV